MIFATDLDRTLIFSYKFLSEDLKEDSICVEYKEDKPLSYMSKQALNELKALKNNSKVVVVPVTTRSISQFERVKAFQDCEYAIVSNGAHILHNGHLFKPWYEKISKELSVIQSEYDDILKILDDVSEYFVSKPKIVDGAFYFMKLPDNSEIIDKVLDYCESALKGLNWNYTLQGLKLYVIPNVISKERALQYLSSLLGIRDIVTAGDGKLDIGFLSVGGIRIIPNGSEVLGYLPNNFNYLEVPDGINGTYSLLKNVEKFCRV